MLLCKQNIALLILFLLICVAVTKAVKWYLKQKKEIKRNPGVIFTGICLVIIVICLCIFLYGCINEEEISLTGNVIDVQEHTIRTTDILLANTEGTFKICGMDKDLAEHLKASGGTITMTVYRQKNHGYYYKELDETGEFV